MLIASCALLAYAADGFGSLAALILCLSFCGGVLAERNLFRLLFNGD
jgi:hypothetical protein